MKLNLKEKISILIVSNNYTHLNSIIKILKRYFSKIYLSKKNEKTLFRIKKYSPKIIIYDNYSINDKIDEVIEIINANTKIKNSQNIIVLNGNEDLLKLNNIGNIFMLKVPINLKSFSSIFKNFINNIKEEVYIENKINQYKQIFNNIDSIIFTISNNKILIANAKFFMFFGVKNINDFNDKGVSYCVICDGPLHKGSSTAIIGGGNSAIEEASYLSTIAKKVYVFVRKPNEAGLRAEPKLVKALKEKNNVEIVYSANVKSLHGKNHLEKAIVDVDGKEREYEITGLFPYIGLKPATDFIDYSLGIKNKDGYIKTNKLMETIIPNVYAIGDVREKEIRQITTAVADGTIAAKDIINKN